MMQRQRVLLYLIHLLQKRKCYTKTNVDKLLFLLLKEYHLDEKISFYSFYPYQYGPFSELFYYDMRKLDNEGYLIGEIPTENAIGEANKLDNSIKSEINAICNLFEEKDVIEYVYSNFPDYTVNSQLIKKTYNENMSGFFSIGYEGKNIDAFLDILIHNNIQLIADVRHNPFSMQFAYVKNKLEQYLKKVNISYVHIPELGINGELRKNLADAADYEKLFKLYKKDILNQNKLGKLIEIGKNKRTALLCMEKDYHSCHRGVISSELERLGLQVSHL